VKYFEVWDLRLAFIGSEPVRQLQCKFLYRTLGGCVAVKVFKAFSRLWRLQKGPEKLSSTKIRICT